jgi:uncharacterized protein YkwD
MLALGVCAGHAQARPLSRQEWLTRFNAERARAGAPPVRLSPSLTQAAQEQAEEMAGDGLRLRSASAWEVADLLRRAGYSARDWREYYTFSDADPENGLRSMRAAVGGCYRDLGVGTAYVEGLALQVLIFGLEQRDYFAAATGGLADRRQIAAEMLARINGVRRRAGMPALVASPLLDRVSQEHADDMLERSYSAHESLEGAGPSERARAAGYPSGIGENIVEQRYSVNEALEAWLASPPHRRNLLDPDCRELGLGLSLGPRRDAAGAYRVVWVLSVGAGRVEEIQLPDSEIEVRSVEVREGLMSPSCRRSNGPHPESSPAGSS